MERSARPGWQPMLVGVSEQPTSVSADGLASWNDAVRRAERGDTVAVIAHGEHVADVVPSGELDRLRETVAVLSDSDLVRAIGEGLADMRAGRVVPAEDVAAGLPARSTSRSASPALVGASSQPPVAAV